MSAVNENQQPDVTSTVRPARKTKSKANGSTGPTTAEGKIVASKNSNKHGCTASFPVVNGKLTPEAEARMILPDENFADWEALKQTWLDEYQPDSDHKLNLVVCAAVAEWSMRRNTRRYNDVEQLLYTEQPDATLWNAEQHARLERFLRYQTKAERSFYRARNALEQLRREKKRDNERAEAFDAKSRALTSPAKLPGEEPQQAIGENEVEPLQARAERSLIQCITVQILNGKTFTLFQPQSENLARIIISSGEPKPTVKRALYFLHGIPDEYQWVTDYENHDGRPHFVITRTSAEALLDLERERQHGAGHVLRID